MPRKSIEVAIEFSHIDLAMYYALGTVNEYGNILRMGYPDNLLHRVHYSKDIGNVSDCYEAGPFPYHRFQDFRIKTPVVIHRQFDKFSVLSPAEHIPGNHIRMMFTLGNYYLISLGNEALAESISHKIDRSRSPGGKNYFLPRRCIYICPDCIPGLLIRFSTFLGHSMDGTVNIGIAIACESVPLLDYGTRSLGCCRIVEVHKVPAIDLA